MEHIPLYQSLYLSQGTYINTTGPTPVANAESISKNLSPDDEYVLHDATQK